MQKMKVYSMYDEKAEAFNRPFIFTTHGQATRAFSDGVRDPQSNLCKHYKDYSLYCIGTFDEETGLLEPLTPVELVCRASEFVALTPVDLKKEGEENAQCGYFN